MATNTKARTDRGRSRTKTGRRTDANLAVSFVPINSLQVYDHNPRKHTDFDVDKIVKSIQRHGFADPIECNSEGLICAGHGRFLAAQKLGINLLPVIFNPALDDPGKFRSYNIASNKTAENSEWDSDLLAADLVELRDDFEFGDFESMGFDEDEFNLMLGGGNGQGANSESLADRFLVPPFSVLDARQGYWQDRKRAWLALGIESELGRGGGLLMEAKQVTTENLNYYRNREIRGGVKMAMHNDPMQRKDKYDQ